MGTGDHYRTIEVRNNLDVTVEYEGVKIEPGRCYQISKKVRSVTQIIPTQVKETG